MAAGGLNVPGMFAVDVKSSTRKTFRFWDGIPSEVTEAAEQLKERERLIKDWAAIRFFFVRSGSDTILGKRNDKPWDLIID